MANAAGFSYEAAKAVYCEEFLVEISRENKSHMAKHRASDCFDALFYAGYYETCSDADFCRCEEEMRGSKYFPFCKKVLFGAARPRSTG